MNILIYTIFIFYLNPVNVDLRDYKCFIFTIFQYINETISTITGFYYADILLLVLNIASFILNLSKINLKILKYSHIQNYCFINYRRQPVLALLMYRI